MTDRTISLAVGSDYLAFSSKPKRSTTTADFFALARSTLERVDGVHGVRIDLADEDENEVRVLTDQEIDSEYAGPHFGLVSTTFDITLPHDRQAQLSGRRGWIGRAEQFRVHLTYGWITPVSCIEVLDALGSDPFGESRCVRSHMEAEFRRLGTGLDYRWLPSGSIKADITLRPAPTPEDADLVLLEHSRPAFDRYVFGFDPSRISADDAAAHFIGGAANGEIDICHQAGDASVQASKKWRAAEAAVKALREARSATSIRGRVRAMVTSGKLINKAALLIADAAAFTESTRSDLARQVRAMYRSGGQTYLRPTVDDAFNDFPEYPVDRLSEIVRLFELQRITNRELTAVVASSLGGGIVGALIAG